MGKKKHRHDWPEAKKLCRLNQNDIAMAKSLGFGPDALVRARPDPKQKWKLPVKYWIHELHFKRFGYVLGEKPLSAPQPTSPEDDEEARRRFEEELYWEDYRERNQDDQPAKRRPVKPAPPAPAAPARSAEDSWMDEVFIDDIGDGDRPF